SCPGGSRLLLRRRYAEGKVEVPCERRNRRTAGRVFENLAVVISGVAAIEQALDDPGLRAVARAGQLYRIFQRRRRSADCVLIRLAGDLIEDRKVGAVPLHRARELWRVARFD